MPFVVLFALLTFWPAVRGHGELSDPMAAVDPPPPALAATTRDPVMTRNTRIFAVVFLTTVGVVVFTQADDAWLFLVTQSVILATIFLSITVLTGLSGQISLCQGTFAAVGGFAVFQLADRFGVSVLVGAVIGAVIAAALGAALAVPVRRLGGVWVAIATLAFAYFFDAVMVKLSWVGGGDSSLLAGTRVPRPVLGPWDLADDRAFLVLCLVVFTVVGIAVILLREGTVGRTLAALRGSEVAAESIGISPGRARVLAFAVSAFIAGLGGALASIHQENVNYGANFAPYAALFWLVLVVSLGARTVEGAAQAGAAFALFDAVLLRGELVGWILRSPERIPDFFPVAPQWRYILFGLTAVQFARHPEGLVESGKHQAARRMEARRLRREQAAVPVTEPAGADGALP
jgi:ABC-type branched-subunit amino acid transport system permease subunit